MFVLSLILLVYLQNVSSYILYLNDVDYARMPPIFHLDRYEPCLYENNGTGVYCSVKFNVVTDGPSELYDMMKNYSDRIETHFNHTQLSYGICLTKTCKHFYKQNTTTDLASTLEECLNDTFWRDYQLKTRVTDQYTCEKVKEGIKLDTSDIVVAAVISILMLLNLVGSIQHFYLGPDNAKKGNAFLTCFSIRKSWTRMVAPAGEGPEPRLARLTGFYGIKTINIIFVIMCHAILPAVVNPDNPRILEEAYQKFPIMGNGTLVVQTFFVMTGFLLIYNMLVDAEKHPTTWIDLPKSILNRWLRLTPTYMVVLAFTATWMRHVGSGPLFHDLVEDEAESCRRDWWLHPLYIINYVDYSHCMMHTWYIAADFQLYCLGVIVYVLTQGRCRKVILGLLFVAGVVMPALHTYYQDLEGVLLLSPETGRNMMLINPTFNHTYKRGHTNVPAFVVGFAVALIVYHLQNNDAAYLKVAKYRSWFLLSLPMMLGVTLLGYVFYRDAPPAHLLVRAFYAGAMKPLFAIAVGILIVGLVFKFEKVYRNILEWPGWATPSRISYCAYVLHVAYIKIINGTRTTLLHLSGAGFLTGIPGCILVCYLLAVPLHLLVEVPFYQLVKLCMSRPAKNKEEIEFEAEKPNLSVKVIG